MEQLRTNTMVVEQSGGNGHGTAQFEASLRAEQRRELLVRPTLFVGLGGTGHRIAVYLKALFIALLGTVPDWLRLMVFDTADEPVLVRLDSGRTVGLEPGTEFVNIGHVPVARIIRHRVKHQAILDRFGESLLQLPPTVLRHGAKQVRLLGLLALYWAYGEVEEHLKGAIWHLAGREREQRAQVDVAQGINIFIANSLCGGTGAGTFLDVAFLARALVEELGDLGDFCQLTGLGVLPEAFHNVKGPYLLPNTVAALKELNHAMSRGDFSAAYPNGRVIEATTAPFNLYYVVDGVDERGRVWPGINDVCRLGAHALYLQMGSQLGRKGENDFDNLDEVLSGTTDDGMGTFLGSIGLSVCSFDYRSVQDACARRQALRIIREGWLRPADDDTGLAAATGFWETQRLDPDDLQKSLAVDSEGVAVVVDMALPGSVRRLPLAQQAQETVAYAEEYLTVRVAGTFRAAVEARSRERVASVIEALRLEAAAVAGDPQQGIGVCVAVVDALAPPIDTARASLREQRLELQDRAQYCEQELARWRAALLRAPTGTLFGRGDRVTTAERHYLQAARAACKTALSREVCTAALHVHDSLAHACVKLTTSMHRLAARLEDAAQLIEMSSNGRSDGLLVDLELADSAYVDDAFSDHAPSLDDSAANCLAPDGNLLDWASRPAAELAQRLYEVAAQPFASMAEHGVEEALRESADGVSPQARRLWLMDQATPSWNLDRARMAGGGSNLVSVTVLGVPNEEDTLFAEQGETLVSTHDDQHIIALRATVGAPYVALQRYPAWQREYEKMRGRRPLHVLPTFRGGSEAALEPFALGLVFRLIYTQGSWYYYRPADRLESPVRLAQGLRNAVGAFASREALAKEVTDRVEQHILVRITTAQAIEQLDAYCTVADEGEVLDELDRQLRKAARDYADRLRETLAASEGIWSDGEHDRS